LDISTVIRIIILIFCLIFSAFFSGSEVALFSLDKRKVRQLQKEHRIVGSYIHVLLENPRRLLVTILLGNTIVNVSASIISVLLALDFATSFNVSKEIALIAQIVLLTLVLLFIGEIAPKLWANKYPLKFSRLVAIPLYWISILFFPIAKIFTDLLKLITSKVKSDKSKTALKEIEISDLAVLGAEKGTIEESEHEIIQSIVEFRDVTAREIMTPRVDITAVSVNTDFDALMQIISDSGHSRIPLYNTNLDNILGIVYAKDLLPFLRNNEIRKSLSLKNIAREAMFIPETKLINDLLKEFQEKKLHLGIVVDEYGGTSGLISLEDILEEIVGEINDEYDREEKSIIKLSENSFLVLGKVSIDELNVFFEQNFSSENADYDTLGGFIFNHAGIIPQQGFHFIYNNYKFTVKEVINKRVNKVLIERISDK
jgi:gliding motility-associated protein GldE